MREVFKRDVFAFYRESKRTFIKTIFTPISSKVQVYYKSAKDVPVNQAEFHRDF